MDYALNDDNNIDSKNEISEMSLGNDNDNIYKSNKNYNLNIKSGLTKSKNKPNNLEDNNNSKGKFINKKILTIIIKIYIQIKKQNLFLCNIILNSLIQKIKELLSK